METSGLVSDAYSSAFGVTSLIAPSVIPSARDTGASVFQTDERRSAGGSDFG